MHRKNSSSRSRSHVGGPSSVQIVLPDGTNVTPRPLLTFSFVRENDNNNNNTNDSNPLFAVGAANRGDADVTGVSPPQRQNPRSIPINTRDVPGASDVAFWDQGDAAGGAARVNAVGLKTVTDENGKTATPKSSERAAGGSTSPLSSVSSINRSRTMRGGQAAAEEDGGGGSTMEALKLQETPTLFTLIIRGSVIATDAVERAAVEAQNTNYLAMLDTRCQTSDRFGARHTQTMVSCQKHKEVQASRPAVRECAVQVTTFDIFDEVSRQRQERTADAEGNDFVHASSTYNSVASAKLAEKKVQEYVKVGGK